MADRREFVIYISSTFKDLKDERDATFQIAAKRGRVLDSCRPSEEGVVATCTADVRKCDVYVGIVGKRYGYRPPGADNPQGKSITELEYDACDAGPGRKKIPRLMFLKNGPFDDDQLEDKAEEIALVKAFRERVARGDAQQAFPFNDPKARLDNPSQLFALLLDQALSEAATRFHQERYGFEGMQGGGGRPRKDLLTAVALIGVAGADEREVAGLAAAGDPRFSVSTVGLAEPQWLTAFDRLVRTAQSACLLVTPPGLLRLGAPKEAAQLAAALRNARASARPLTLVLAGVAPAQLLAEWSDAETLVVAAPDTWTAADMPAILEAIHTALTTRTVLLAPTGDAEYDAIRADLCAATSQLSRLPQLALPIVIVAPDLGEMRSLVAAGRPGFAAYDKSDRRLRVAEFDRLAKGSRRADKAWPANSYGDDRAQWRCFGPGEPPVLGVVLKAVAAINDARQGTRERRLLPRLRIVPKLYRFEDLLEDQHGSAGALLDAAEGGSLIVVDEFALLHPRLRPAAKRLLELRRTAVVSISASDPAHSPTRTLLLDTSFLRLGLFLNRFESDRDPRCEVAVNSVQRLERWIRMAVPEMLALGDAAEALPELVSESGELFAPTSGAA